MMKQTLRQVLPAFVSVSLCLSACQPTVVANNPPATASPSLTATPVATPLPSPSALVAKVLSSEGDSFVFATTSEVQRLVDSQLVDKYNALGFKLFQQIFQEEGQQRNILISPLSIMLALAMAYNGSAGETRAQFAKVLELEGFSIAEFNELSHILWRSLSMPKSEHLHVQIANSIWSDHKIQFKPEFLERTQSAYQAQVANLDFTHQPQQSADLINAWIEKRTAGLIKEVVTAQEVLSATLFLVNTVYMKAGWKTAFDEKKTDERSFSLVSGNLIQTPTLFDVDYENFWQDPGSGTQYLQKAFNPTPVQGDDSRSLRYAMTFVLPANDKTLSKEVEGFDIASWKKASKALKIKNGAIEIPIFETGFGVTLNDVLKKMGLDLPFDQQQADFTEMLPFNTSISSVFHKTKIKLHESGVEAAAVTIIRYPVPIASSPEIEFVFEANRPFLYLIHDLDTGSILFVGSLINPTDKGESD